MGGIFGFVADIRDQRPDILEKMSKAMVHRGKKVTVSSLPPFYGGIVAHPWETGTKIVSTPDRDVVALCEGEVYNSRELAESMGIPYAGKAANGFDMIPRLYARYGKDFVRHVNGVFGVALWDQRNRTLVLARDHLGSHSVFYAQAKDGFFFASLIPALLATDMLEHSIDLAALDEYLASLAVSPPRTLFEAVRAVRPGHVLLAGERSSEEHDYWRLGAITEDYEKPEDEFAGELREIFEDAVKIRAQYGGKAGVLVSGGVDTSTVAAVLALSGCCKDLAGFSIAFAEKDFSDAPLQEIMYSRLCLERHQILLGPKEFAAALADGAGFLDSPVNDVAFAGMLHAFRSAADSGFIAVFEGEGSDEIFCTGHSLGELNIQRFLFLPFPVRRFLFGFFKHLYSEDNSLPAKGVRLLARIGMFDLERRCTWVPGFSWRTRKRLLGRAYDSTQTWETARNYYRQTKLKDRINVYQYGLTRLFLPDDLLFKNERMASAAGVINRTPFIDFRLVEKAFEVPAKFKLQQPGKGSDGTKLIFKKAMRGLVPDEILDRKKTRGFSQPTAVWFRNELRDFVHDTIFSQGAKIHGWLDRRAVEQVYEDFIRGRVSSDYFLNSLVILELWMQKHLR